MVQSQIKLCSNLYLDILHDEARLFHLKTGNSERLLTAMDSIHHVKWSPRKPGLVALGCNRGLLVIYDVNTRQILNAIANPEESCGNCEDMKWSLGESLIFVRY
jgi:WD40 repeat protein